MSCAVQIVNSEAQAFAVDAAEVLHSLLRVSSATGETHRSWSGQGKEKSMLKFCTGYLFYRSSTVLIVRRSIFC